MNDDFLHQFREAPRAEFAEALYGRISRMPVLRVRLRRWAFATLAALLMIGASGLTPWGLAFARDLFRFFSPAEGDSFPLPMEEFSVYGVESTPVATFNAQLQPAGPAVVEPDDAPTSIPATFSPPSVEGCDDAAAALTYRCQVAKAEAAVGFDAKEPPGFITGMSFGGIGVNPTLQLLSLKYTAIGGGSYLTITQIRGDFKYSSWGQVPPSAAVEHVRVGEHDGEYVRGMYVVKPGAASATWEPEASVRRLRWEEGDTLFEIRLDGHVARVEWLDRDTMVALAESLVHSPAIVEGQLRPEYLTTVENAEMLAGFDVLSPTVLPEGFVFDFAEYHADTNTVWLRYAPASGQGIAGLLVIETPVAVTEPVGMGNYPPEVVEVVTVGSAEGQYIAGSSAGNAADPEWNPDDPRRTLAWTSGDLRITLIYHASQWYGGRLGRADMIAIAESMR